MSTSKKQTYIFTLSLFIVLFMNGCVYKDTGFSLVTTPVTNRTLKDANENQISLKSFLRPSKALVDTVPVGSIMPIWVGDGLLNLTEDWMYCNGDLVEDEDSVFYGERLPRLNDGRFLMGAMGTSYGTSGGTNHQIYSKSHNHGGVSDGTTLNASNEPVKGLNEEKIRIPVSNHQHLISEGGEHRHSGDKRPKWFGIVYAIKIK